MLRGRGCWLLLLLYVYKLHVYYVGLSSGQFCFISTYVTVQIYLVILLRYFCPVIYLICFFHDFVSDWFALKCYTQVNFASGSLTLKHFLCHSDFFVLLLFNYLCHVHINILLKSSHLIFFYEGEREEVGESKLALLVLFLGLS